MADKEDSAASEPIIADPRASGRLKRLQWEDGTYQDVTGYRHRCWISPEKLHGLKLYILDIRTLTEPILISEHSFDSRLIPEDERESKAFMIMNATQTRPKISVPISMHPTRGEAQERAERVYARSVADLFIEDQDGQVDHVTLKSAAQSLLKAFR